MVASMVESWAEYSDVLMADSSAASMAQSMAASMDTLMVALKAD